MADLPWKPSHRSTDKGVIVATKRSINEPHDELSAWLDKLTDELPEGAKAIVLIDTPTEGGVLGSFAAVGYADDEEIITAWRRHLAAWHQSKADHPEAR